jgi:hypothetical protein
VRKQGGIIGVTWMAAFADAGAPKARRKAARANKRVESNVGSGEFEALTIKGDLGATEDHGVAARISHG